MALKKLLKGIKKGLKGSKEHQESVAKKDAGKGGKNWYPGKFVKKAAKQVAKDVKSAAKGSKEYQAGKAKRKAVKAKKKEGKAWTKAVKAQKKTGGASMNELIKARNAAKASGNKAAYAKAQNQINKAYGSKKVHDPGKPKSLPKKKPVARGASETAQKRTNTVAPPKKAAKKSDDLQNPPNLKIKKASKPSKPDVDLQPSEQAKNKAKDAKAKKQKRGPDPIEPYPPREDQGPKFMKEGGKVESNPYGWPSSDSRKR